MSRMRYSFKQEDCDKEAIQSYLNFHITLQKLIPVSDDVETHGFDTWEEMKLRVKVLYYKSLIEMSSRHEDAT